MVQRAIRSSRVVLVAYRLFRVAAKGFSVIVFRAFWGLFRACGTDRNNEEIRK